MKRFKTILRENMKRFGTKNLKENQELKYDIDVNRAVAIIGHSEINFSLKDKLTADVIKVALEDVEMYHNYGDRKNSVQFDCELNTEQGSKIDMKIRYSVDGDLEGVDFDDRITAREHGITEQDIVADLNNNVHI